MAPDFQVSLLTAILVQVLINYLVLCEVLIRAKCSKFSFVACTTNSNSEPGLRAQQELCGQPSELATLLYQKANSLPPEICCHRNAPPFNSLHKHTHSEELVVFVSKHRPCC